MTMTRPALSTRQAQVAELVARGHPDKVIAQRIGLSVYTVREYVKEAAARIPGEGWPRQRLTLWFFNISDDEPPPNSRE
jgi:FixJ family two-component response regulator